jgi:hypothetical protein
VPRDRERRPAPEPEPSPAALYALGNQRGHLADRLVTPWWYHPVLGGALALLVASFATRRLLVVAVAAVLYVAVLVTLPHAYRRSTGVWVDAPTPPQARHWARALGWTAAAALLVAVVAAGVGLWAVALAAAVAAFWTTQVFGRRFDDALREELRRDPEIGFKIEER